jgi:murein DD-endopeptidase MepM/ murein hydrolase activator NlpD
LTKTPPPPPHISTDTANTVIIAHGHNYFSSIAGVEQLIKPKGDKVGQGDLIAFTGDTATLMDDGGLF